jgi:hypothetical protein
MARRRIGARIGLFACHVVLMAGADRLHIQFM